MTTAYLFRVIGGIDGAARYWIALNDDGVDLFDGEQSNKKLANERLRSLGIDKVIWHKRVWRHGRVSEVAAELAEGKVPELGQ